MSDVVLVVEPSQPPLSWDAFRQKAGPYAVALDGYVCEGPKMDLSLPAANFNHHEEVKRPATRATCAQVLLAIRQGFFQRFDKPTRVYVNDCDQDVCLSWAVLHQAHLARNIINPLFNKLVFVEDMMDTTSGTYPFPEDLPFLETMAWIFEPYDRARANHGLDSRDPDVFRGIITDVELRILSYLAGSAGRKPLDTRYECLHRVGGVTFVRELGAQARVGMFSDGIQAYVSLQNRADGSRVCTAGRSADFVPFDVPRFLSRCNEEEGLTEAKDRWGGGDTVGGSPRGTGTRLSDEVLLRLAGECWG